MRSFVKLFLVALGFSTIDLIWLIKPAAEPTQRAAYHFSGNIDGLYLAVLFDVLILTSILLALLLVARKHGKPRIAIWAGLFLWLPWVFYMDTCMLMHLRFHRRPSLALFWIAFLATSWLVICLRPATLPLFERVASVSASIMVFTGLFGAFLLCRLVWYDVEVHSIEAHRVFHRAPEGLPAQPHRVIWIVFDELSYRQLFERRFPGLQMPAFDSFAAQSTVFTNVAPIGTATEIVLPGLISGTKVDDIQTSPSKRFLLHNTATKSWEPFNQHTSVFQDALDAGYSTAVAGWYNPYCDIFPAVLDHCFWVSSLPLSNSMAMNGKLLNNMAAPLDLIRFFFLTAGPFRLQRAFTRSPFPGSGPTEKALHQRDLAEIQAAADHLLRDPSIGFMLLHLPVPHPPGIYNRSTGKLAEDGSYVDNLALADHCLATIRQTLQASGQWDSSTVVVMGDHAWRTIGVWFNGKDWTHEDGDASQNGKYDSRPAYVVKLPGQTTGARIDSPYRAVNTRSLFDGVLNHSIETPAQLTSWAQAAH